MGRLKSGVVLLLLAVPFALYAAWQVQGVSRADLIVSDPPSEKGLPGREQLAAARAKADKWSEDVRKAAAVTYQFRTPGPDDRAADDECYALARAAGARADELIDLEKFLSDTDDPVFVGALRTRYLEWRASKAELSKAGKAVENWFTTPLPAVDGPEPAAKAVAAFYSLVGEYTRDSRFSDPAKAAGWKVRGRCRVIEALADTARGPYDKVVARPLPLPSEADSPDVRKALGAPRAIREQVKLLQDELTQIEDAKLTVPARAAADARAAVKRADEWAARERLLALFAEPTLFTNPTGAADWLEKVKAQFDRTQSAEDRDLLRRKVQEFCEAFVPRAVELEDFVLIDGKRTRRADVEVEYFDAKGKSHRVPLTNNPDPESLNEFTVARKFPGERTRVWVGATESFPNQLQPTKPSEAAVAFHEARKNVGSGPGMPKWTAKAIDELKIKCKPVSGEVNKLKIPGTKPDAPAPEIWNRLENLSRGAEADRTLFEKGQ